MTDGRDPLVVNLQGHTMGQLHPTHGFMWDEGWAALAPLNAIHLSHSLPFGVPTSNYEPFFGGLLPEGIGLDRLAREIKSASNDLFALLMEVGADVGGSVTIGEPRPPLDPIEISETDFAGILEQAAGYIRGSSVGGGGSAATGVQQKVALTRDAKSAKWLIGRGSTPSTHLLKPVPVEYAQSARSEAFLNDVAVRLGLSGHDAWVEPAGNRVVLVVERYDRAVDSQGQIVRLHQEDAAQALGLPWGGDAKYESQNPAASLKNIAQLLRQRGSAFGSTGTALSSDALNSAGPAAVGEPRVVFQSDRERLLALVTLNVAAGNTDAHAKNFSFMLPPLQVPMRQAPPLRPVTGARLADAYDLVPQTFLNPQSSPLAMSINGVASAARVTALDLVAEGSSWGLRPNRAARVVEESLAAIRSAVAALPNRHGEPARLREFVDVQAASLLAGDPAWTSALPPAIHFL